MLFLNSQNILETLLAILYFFVFTFLLKKWKVFHTPFLNGWGYVAVFIVKFGVAIFLWEIHLRFFNDAYNYLQEAARLNQIWYESPINYFKLLTGIGENLDLIKHYIPETNYWTNSGLYNDAKNTIRFDAILSILSFGNIYVQFMWGSLITLVGMKAIYDTLKCYTSKRHWFLFFSIMLLPTITFWGASFLKELYLILGIGLFFKACFFDATIKKRILPFIFGFFFLICIKPYVVVCLIPAVVFFYTWKFTKENKGKWALASFALTLILACTMAKIILKNPVSIISRKQADFINVGKGGLYFMNDTCFFYFNPEKVKHFDFKGNNGYLQDTLRGEIIHFETHKHESHLFMPDTRPWHIYYKSEESGSYISVTPINESSVQLIKNIPQAIFNVLFRPLPSDPPYSMEKWLILIETWLILFSIVLGIIKKPKLSKKQKNIVYSLIIFIVLLSLIIGWTIPVLGALVRYRIPITIALVILSWVLWQEKKIFNFSTK